jgi:hypothetical protein
MQGEYHRKFPPLEDFSATTSFVIKRLQPITRAIQFEQALILPHIVPHKRESHCSFTAI